MPGLGCKKVGAVIEWRLYKVDFGRRVWRKGRNPPKRNRGIFMAVTVKDLAQMTGFSTSTISRVLSKRGYVDEETRKIVERAVEESGYRYKPTSGKKNSIKMVMLILGELSNEIYAQSIKGISSVFDAHNIMYVGTFGDRFDTEKLEFYMRRAISGRFEGMILFTPIETPTFVRMMQTCSIPCVALNRPVESIEMDQICMDNKAAGRLAVQYLADRGHRRIACVSIEDSSSVAYRTRGYLDGMDKRGLEVREDDILRVEHSYDGGISAGSIIAVSKKDITAIYTPNELLAQGVIEGLRRCGKKVPEDISVIATDNTKISIRNSVPLTTVSCNHYEMGVQAALLFMERQQSPNGKRKQIYLPPEIIERESVRVLDTE